jgi:LDH2 family malate/lactate/ureidoglycolate dehydrogenase
VAEGFSQVDARFIAEAMIRTERRGVSTHGLWFLPHYIGAARRGVVNVTAQPQVIAETAATAVVDADAALGHIAMKYACELVATKARDAGAASVLVRNSNHFGAAGLFALLLAEQGLVGFLASNGPPIMSAPNGGGRLICNQPIAYGVPDPDGRGAIVFDVALSTVAGAKVAQMDARDEAVPVGWLVDSHGEPTTDPSLLWSDGALTPAAGDKGFGLAVLVEIMAGLLSGAAMMSRVGSLAGSEPTRTGHWVTAFDPDAFMPADEFRQRMVSLRGEVDASTHKHGSDVPRLPGERARRAELAAENTLELDESLFAALETLAIDVGIPDILAQARQHEPTALQRR